MRGLFATLAFCFIVQLAVRKAKGQLCPVSDATITSKFICQGSLWGISYICNDPGGTVIWSGTAIKGEFVITYQVGSSIPILTVNVHVTEHHTTNSSCIYSTLSFTASNLNALNGLTLSCRFHNKTTVVVSIPRTPSAVSEIQLSGCDDKIAGCVILKWATPNDNNGQDIEIIHYVVNVVGPIGHNCTSGSCNVTTTTVTITGLQYNTSYMVTVSAVNCIGMGNYSQPVMITIVPAIQSHTTVTIGTTVISTVAITGTNVPTTFSNFEPMNKVIVVGASTSGAIVIILVTIIVIIIAATALCVTKSRSKFIVTSPYKKVQHLPAMSSSHHEIPVQKNECYENRSSMKVVTMTSQDNPAYGYSMSVWQDHDYEDIAEL